MAEKLALFGSLLNCPVCQETFTDPVSLNCRHSFCSECLKTFWEDRPKQKLPLVSKKIIKGFAGCKLCLETIG